MSLLLWPVFTYIENPRNVSRPAKQVCTFPQRKAVNGQRGESPRTGPVRVARQYYKRCTIPVSRLTYLFNHDSSKAVAYE